MKQNDDYKLLVQIKWNKYEDKFISQLSTNQEIQKKNIALHLFMKTMQQPFLTQGMKTKNGYYNNPTQLIQ
jgi:hypothetical protein